MISLKQRKVFRYCDYMVALEDVIANKNITYYSIQLFKLVIRDVRSYGRVSIRNHSQKHPFIISGSVTSLKAGSLGP